MTRFDAFVSYSRAADGELAPALHVGLQRLAKPWSKRRALEVFRDETGLAVNPDLWAAIVTALDASDWFILLASPAAAQSRWVNQEIEHWAAKDEHARERILCVLTSGTMIWDPDKNAFSDDSDAAPEALRALLESEPRYVDLAWAATEPDLTLSNPRFREAVADVAAPLHGVSKDQLIGEDIRQHKRSVRLRRSAVASLAAITLIAVAASVFAVRSARDANDQRDIADEQRQQATTARDEALALATEAQARALTLASEQQLGTDPELAALLALEADNTVQNPATFASMDSVAGSLWRSTIDVVGAREKVVISPDGALATTHGGGQLVLWDVVNERSTTFGFEPTSAPVFSNRSDRIAAVSVTETLVLNADGSELRRLSTGQGAWGAAFSSDGERLATVGSDGISVWDLSTGAKVWSVGIPDYDRVEFLEGDGELVALGNDGLDVYTIGSDAPPQEVLAERPQVVGFDSTRSRLLTTDGANAGIWDTATWQHTALPIDGLIRSAHFSRAGDLLITNLGLDDFGPERWSDVLGMDMILWDLASVAGVDALTEADVLYRAPDASGRFEPDGERIIVQGAGVDVLESDWRVDAWPTDWRIIDRSELAWFAPDPGRVVVLDDFVSTWAIESEPLAVLGDPDGNREATLDDQGRLVVEGWDGIDVWDDSGAPVFSFDSTSLNTAVVSPDGKLAVTLDSEGLSIRRHDEPTVRLIEPEDGYEVVPSAAFDPSGDSIAVASADGVMLYGLDGQSNGIVTSEPTWNVRFDATGDRLLTSGSSGFSIWTADGELVGQLERPGEYPSYDIQRGNVVVRTDRGVTVWDLDGARLFDLEQAGIADTAISSDGTVIATAGDEGIQIWNLDGTRRRVITSQWVERVAFDNSGQRLVGLVDDEGGSFANTIQVWSIDGAPLTSFEPTSWPFELSFSRDGNRIVAGQRAFSLHEIPDRESLRGELIGRLNRTEFTDAECQLYGIDPCDSPIAARTSLADD